MHKSEPTIFTNMCMICDGEGNVLVQDRVNPDWSGLTFPGGHVEPGESFTDSVIREVFEETGLKVSKLSLCGIKDWVTNDGERYVVLMYKTSTFFGELVSSDEGEVRWVPLSDMPKMQLASGMSKMLRLFCDDELSEQFFYKDNGEWNCILK